MGKYNFEVNSIYCEDNKIVLPDFPDNCVDLIYIDPPFFSGKNYELIWHDEQEKRAFEDRWAGDINHYINWMERSINELHRILKETGSFYIHCDRHANAYLKILCDQIFGYDNLINEIIWCYSGGGGSKKTFGQKHDNIYLYGKSRKWTFNADSIRVPYTEGGGTDRAKKANKIMKKTIGKTTHQWKPNNLGKVPEDWWLIPFINPLSRERRGYPTQKPEVLLERIIKASSNEGDIVLDAFCGCGTTIAVAKQLNRKYIGIDISPTACNVMAERIQYDKNKIIRMTYTLKEIMKELRWDQFQTWACNQIGGRVNSRKIGDGGVDGWKYYKNEKYPISVKQSDVSTPAIRDLESVIHRFDSKKGYIIGHYFSKPSIEEIDRFNIKNKGIHQIVNFTTKFIYEFKNENENENGIKKRKTLLDF